MNDNLKNVKALVFDAYGTLLDVTSLDERLTQHFGEKATAINAVWRQKQLQYTWLRSLMDRYKPFSQVTREALQYACNEQAVTLTEAALEDLMDHYLVLNAFPEVPGILEKLSTNYTCAIFSNADMPMLQGACDKNGITPFLNAILSVDAVGRNKPAPEVYALATEQFDCKPSEIAFISSNTWDVAGAASFGLKSIWLRRSGTMETMGYVPTLVINELNDLL